MSDMIMTIGKLSMQGSIVILVVFALRFLFDKLSMPKKYINILWFIPFICLILPWRPQSDFSVWKYTDNEDRMVSDSGVTVMDNYVVNLESYNNVDIDVDFKPSDITDDMQDNKDNVSSLFSNQMSDIKNDIKDKENLFSKADILFGVWLGGLLAIMVYSIVDYIRLTYSIKVSYNAWDNVFYAEEIDVPFVLGIIKPRIYIPVGIDIKSARWIIEHESTHIQRKDTLKKMFMYVISCVHWFNPMVWLAFWFYGKDMEMACDEETVKRLGIEYKHEYATALLLMSAKKGISKLATFPAFGGGDIKERICNVLKGKRTIRLMTAMVAILVLVMSGVFLTNGRKFDEASKDIKEEQENVGMDKENETVKEKETSAIHTTEEETVMPVQKTEFTVEMLLKLSEERSFVEEFINQGWENNLKYSNFIADKSSDNSLTWLYRCPIEYEGNEFEFQVYYTVGKNGEKENVLDSFMLCNKVYKTSYMFDRATASQEYVLEYLEKEYAPEYYMEVQLPKEINKDNYEFISENTYGFVYDKDYREIDKSSTCYASHYAPVGIGWKYAQNSVEFDENGKLKSVSYMYNYSHKDEEIEYVDGCQMQAVICTVYSELFIPEYGENGKVNTYDKFVEENGREPEKTTMEYWYVFMAEPDVSYCYFVYLNKDYFTRDDAIRMARSVKIAE